ncbi:MAG: GxxExxY protein [Phycisphaerae bacterium]|nr:GxxExxY protein [Gemmatimonadaceae bacterium]
MFDALTYGIPESAYHRAMRIALSDLGLAFSIEHDLPVTFRGQLVGKYRADLIVEEKIIVEIKTAPRIVEVHVNQLHGYLKISQLQVGLLLNFGPEPTFNRYFLKSRTSPVR